MDDCTFDFAVTGAIPRSDAQINRAKRMAVGGGRKKCRKGKSCSATCIDSGEYCLVDLPWVTSNAMGKVRNHISTAKSAPDNRTQELKDRGFKTAGAKRIAQADRDAAAGKKVEIDKAPRVVNKEPGQKGRTSKQAERSAAIKAVKSLRSVDKDRKEHAGFLKDMGVPSGKATAMAKEAWPSNSKSKKADGTLTAIAKDMGVGTKTAKEIARSERERLKPEKSQIAQLQSVLKLGSLTRQEVGRDYSGLINEAKNLKANKMSELDKLEKLENSLKRNQGKAEDIRVVREKGEKLWGEIREIDKAIKGPGSNATGNTRWGREDARDADNRLAGEKLTRVGDKSYNKWEESYAPGSRKLGEGSYGTAMLSADGKTVVKRGDIATTEAGILEKVGKADLGPKLLAADIDGKPQAQMSGVEMKNGRIAMGVVPGKEMGRDADVNTRYGPNKISAPDVYWKAMADLHRQGIAHNDAHIDNILVDDKGKGRWVDLGAAQASPKAALAEAMGIFSPLKGGDSISVPSGATGTGNWQTKGWDGAAVRQAERAKQAGGETWNKFKQDHPVASKVWDNRIFAVDNMKKMGLDVNEINSIIAHGIRSTSGSYDNSDGFSKLTDAQAQKILNTLYEGI